MVSRNPHKLMKVVDYLLRNGSSFVTANYYIRDGYVASRYPLLRPAHYTDETLPKMKDRTGAPDRLAEILNSLAQ